MRQVKNEARGRSAEAPVSGTGRPTLKTIAYMTGLGITTVSKALKDAPDISTATKERVKLVAKQIGYRPNRAGVRLRTGKTNVVSVIVPVEDEAMGLSTHLIYGISRHLRTTRYHLIVTPYSLTDDPLDPVRYIVETGSADGVVLSRTEPLDPRITFLRDHSMPFVTHGRTEFDFDHAYFDFDNSAYAEQAVDELAQRGRGRIALLMPPPYLTYSKYMQDGLLRGLEHHDLLEVPFHGITTDSSFDAIKTEVMRLMSGRGRPDGVVCGSAASAIATIIAAEELGLTLGREFDLAVKDSFGLMQKFRRGTIAFHEDFRATGVGLAKAIIGAIEGNDVSDLQYVTRPILLGDEMPIS
ncbi:LacI family transcriptional regulator [Qingshengfaniella alkalisoli]|uniref:LacI family DNA-binding transcriptional regulator n=1 Tax=Qingshengfaniella alkalisoli TaxID=2599296 RepID=A0A5B8I5A1_9RHOB|nr:LacI family transcriptional regulator [Qingshengfaniella alkalisoli]QDY68469.1 LacI family DNA-binding transcriptional regulator [Qingshengfaniella alkalisoli]